jgi:hypothetical protein
MTMHFEELDETTRQYMLTEFEVEEGSKLPYRGHLLSSAGRAIFAELMRTAIRSGNEQTLIQTLTVPAYWQPIEVYKKGTRRINIQQAAERLGLSEFNTWYVRGLSQRLLHEGVSLCQVYRAAHPKWGPDKCSLQEGQVFAAKDIYQGHRARYWPAPGNSSVLSIPFGPNCHHTIRRV